jgi:hypothetical protein
MARSEYEIAGVGQVYFTRERWKNGYWTVARDSQGNILGYKESKRTNQQSHNVSVLREELATKNINQERATVREKEPGEVYQQRKLNEIVHPNRTIHMKGTRARKYQYRIKYNGYRWISVMSNSQLTEDELLEDLYDTVEGYHTSVDSVDYIELVVA